MKPESYKIGEKINSWTLKEIIGMRKGTSIWLCICKCGNTSTVRESQLKIGKSKSCGKGTCNLKYKDLTGKIFGYLVVLSLSKFINGRSYYYCRCICNKIIEVFAGNLVRGNTKSCRCIVKPRRNRTDFVMIDKFHKYINESKKRKYQFSLSFDKFKQLTSENCGYCNKKPINVHKYRKHSCVYNGIDRIDNNMGYIDNNVITCCSDCNSEKHSIGLPLIKKVYVLAKKRGLI